MGLKYKKISYKENKYAVIEIAYKNEKKPMVLNWKDFKYFKGLDKSWKCNQLDFISCVHTHDDKTKEIFVHDIVMALAHKEGNRTRENIPIVHINRNGLDNRRDNLIYDNIDKEENKNQKKKKRTIKLPKSSGINPDEIPTYVWYLKPNGSHGERFSVEIGDIKWKTTSSKKLSIRYKLEEAKKYLRDLKKANPQIFEDRCMNGEFTKSGKNLLHSYYRITSKAGYDIKKENMNNITDKYLSRDYSQFKDSDEKKLLNTKKKSGIEKRLFSSLPKDSGLSLSDLPKYSYYHSSNDKQGDYFVVEDHPEQKNKIWKTDDSKNISTKSKFKELKKYLKKLF